MVQVLLLFVILIFCGCDNNVHYHKKVTYFDNGDTKKIIPYKIQGDDSVKHGKLKEYYKNDQLWYSQQWRNGKKDGRFLEYYENGTLKIEGKYKEGKLADTGWTYYKNGDLRSWEYYQNGVTIDYEKYKKNGYRDTLDVQLLGNTPLSDTISLGDSVHIKARIGNRMKSLTATMILADSAVKSSNHVYDTIVIYQKTKPFEYYYKPEKIGLDSIYLKMDYIIPMQGDKKIISNQIIPYSIVVKENKISP